MQKEHRKREYKITYAKCKKGSMHSEEPLNIVCLEDSCCDRRLICSICKTEEHAQHKTQPLKLYISSLQATFNEESTDVRQKLNEMEEKKNQMLATLQETVTNISQKFRNLETQIVNRYKVAKQRILEEDTMKRGFQNIYQILSTPNHPDIGPMITRYTKMPLRPSYPNPERLVALQSAVIQQINATISFYMDESAKIGITNSVKVLYPAGIVFDGETIEQVPNNSMNLCLLNEPITTENHKVKIKILSDNPNIAMGIITMAQFKKYGFVFDPTKATSNFACWISSDGKGSNYNSNTIAGFAKEDVFDMTLKKGQLIINKRKNKQHATLLAKDLGVDWYFFWALLGPGKIQLLQKGYKK